MEYLELHREATVVDTHCDTLKCLLGQFTSRKDSMWEDRSDTNLGERTGLGHVDFPRLRDGGVDCQVFAISSERSRTPAHPLRTALEMISRFNHECELNKNIVTQVRNHDDIMKAKEEGKIGLMLSIEGADVIEGKVELFGIFYELGVRIVGLVHSLRNQLADGVSDRRTGGGLSQLGIQSVEELERIGMIVDVSHLNDEGFWDVVENAKNPIIASHSNSRAICDHPRNMTDDMIVALAEIDGVMGMNFAPSFVNPDIATVGGVIDHIDHIVNLVGPAHVGLGSDFDGIPYTPIGLEEVTNMPAITQELVRREYSEEDIRKILGVNHLRLFKKVLG